MRKILEILLNSAINSVVLFILGIAIKYLFSGKIVIDYYLLPTYMVIYFCIKYIFSSKSDIKLTSKKGEDSQFSIGKNNKQTINK